MIVRRHLQLDHQQVRRPKEVNKEADKKQHALMIMLLLKVTEPNELGVEYFKVGI